MWEFRLMPSNYIRALNLFPLPFYLAFYTRYYGFELGVVYSRKTLEFKLGRYNLDVAWNRWW